MSNINGYPETCVVCGQKRTCDDGGYCHECDQAEIDRVDSEYQADGISRFAGPPPCMQCGNPSTTTHEGTPVCNECLAYFLDKSERRRYDYTDSATANDMRFGSDSEGF